MASNQRLLLTMYKQRLRAADRFQNWNYKQYFRRHAREEFHKALHETDENVVSAFITKAKADQVVVERQGHINGMYAHNDLIINVLKANAALEEH
eukprot:TRINITY_DN1938_c0_g1_i2.p2 TRINITY_DN1938_c0_g1~~TRINITY_DN1938_c0_g1_i2.p2  ORF type:complete len:107 (+),score=27.24 TRINITY_DN1938_c0_g1_i2:37-321(+)